MTDPLEGGCACRKVRYRLEAAPIVVHCCHCRLCQRQTGSAFVINALIETAQVTLLGVTPVRTDTPTESGRPHGIYRCPTCATAVWSEYGGVTTVLFVRVGTLDEPAALPPDVHIFTRSQLPWVHLPVGARTFDEFYDRAVDLAPATLARWRAAVGKPA